MQRPVAAIALVTAACSGADPLPIDPIDATELTGPITYRLGAGAGTGGDLGDLEVWIAGEPGSPYQTSVADLDALLAIEVTVELRVADLVVDLRQVRPAEAWQGCSGFFVPMRASESLCVEPHGELRYRGASFEGDTGACSADGFCFPACDPTVGCGGDRKCTSVVLSIPDPQYSQLACVDAGPQGLAAPCTWAAAATGGFVDDCASGLICEAGTCRPICGSFAGVDCPDGYACVGLPGHPPEVANCQSTFP